MADKNDILRIISQLEQASYQKGWDAAFAHILATAQKTSQGSLPLSPAAPKTVAAPSGESVNGTALEVIKANPGLAGHEIVKAVQKVFPPDRADAIERTVRTALFRFKKANKIENREGKWFPLK